MMAYRSGNCLCRRSLNLTKQLFTLGTASSDNELFEIIKTKVKSGRPS